MRSECLYRMMRRLFAVLLISAFSVQAETYGDWVYSVGNGEAIITGYTGSGGAVIIPSELNGIPVRGLWLNHSTAVLSISSLTIPNSLTVISVSHPERYRNLTNVVVASDNAMFSAQDGALYNKSGTTLLFIPAGKRGAFAIPSGVTSIGDEAALGCSALVSVTLPESVTSIGANAFRGCTDLANINLPNSVTNVGPGAFSSCPNLISITIPSNVTSIGESTFSGCSSLTSITIPTNVTSIGDSAFLNCSRLTSINLPTNVTNIGANAFRGCTDLTNVTIPSSLSNIDSYAFSYCPNLRAINFLGNPPSGGYGLFDDSPKVIVFVTPESTGWVDTYASRPVRFVGGTNYKNGPQAITMALTVKYAAEGTYEINPTTGKPDINLPTYSSFMETRDKKGNIIRSVQTEASVLKTIKYDNAAFIKDLKNGGMLDGVVSGWSLVALFDGETTYQIVARKKNRNDLLVGYISLSTPGLYLETFTNTTIRKYDKDGLFNVTIVKAGKYSYEGIVQLVLPAIGIESGWSGIGVDFGTAYVWNPIAGNLSIQSSLYISSGMKVSGLRGNLGYGVGVNQPNWQGSQVLYSATIGGNVTLGKGAAIKN